MEALIILLAEFLIVPIVLSVSIVAVTLVVFIMNIFEVFFLLLGAKNLAGKIPKLTKREDKSVPPKKPSGFITIKWASLSLFALLIGTVLVVNFLLFDPTAKWLLAKVGQRKDMEVNVAKVSGNLFSGKFDFHDLKVKRESEIKNSFDLKTESVSLDIDIWSLIFRPVTLEHLIVKNVKGDIRQPDIRKDPKNSNRNKIKTKRIFIVKRYRLEDADVSLSKGANPPVQVSLNKAENDPHHPLRSQYAIFDLLFRSNVSGSIDGNKISIGSSGTENARVTKWDMMNLPVAPISRIVTKPPIGWFKDGVIDVKVEDKWRLNEKAEIKFDWHLNMRGVKVVIPENANSIQKTLAKPIASYINNKEEDIDLRFKLIMDEKQFESASSLDVSDIGTALAKGLAKAIADRTDNKIEDVKKGISDTVKGFKSFLDKRRQ